MKIKEKKASFTSFSIFGSVLYWWGLFISILLGLAVILNPASILDTDFLLGSAFFGLLPLGAGYFIRKKAKQIKNDRSLIELEQIALNASEENNGVLTIARLSVQTGLSLEEANLVLESLCSRGIFRPEADDSGTVVYYCDEFQK